MEKHNIARDSALSCLLITAEFHGISAEAHNLASMFAADQNFSVNELILAAKKIGFHAKSVKQDPSRFLYTPVPAIAQNKSGEFFIVAKFGIPSIDEFGNKKNTSILIQYPGQVPKIIKLNEFTEIWSGTLIFLKSKANFEGEISKFDFTWFIPSIIKYRKYLLEIFVVSIALQIIGLATPMFFQVIMDKVLVNHAMATLDVIAIGLCIVIVFEILLTSIRTYVFSNCSSKIDVELGGKLFSHLIRLPLKYFHARQVGDSVARVRELENIRSFLTGNSVSLILDVAFSFIFIGTMFWYSEKLATIVILSLPLYFIISFIFTPILRRALADKFSKSSENQSFLFETINGIDTVKAMALENRWQSRWETQLASYVTSGLATVNIATAANSSVNLISKLVTAAIMWFGAIEVIGGKLSIGELVAFNMLAGQVSSPILRVAQLWSDFQQVGVSVSRLGDILNTPTEAPANRAILPKVLGDISFQNVSFRYSADRPNVLRNLNLRIEHNKIIGIVGRSGSGKSTLSKLIQRSYVPDSGRVLIDGHDIGNADIASLRSQIGVVLQENVLFSGSVRENIAISNPSLAFANIVAAAKLAGAHEFICELPNGYETKIGENGIGLSGGQRQRIAIARTLIGNPRILIFDEATSALDYESEKIIQENMRKIAKGRTVLIIAHRLSSIRDADEIIVMEKGEISEIGSHEMLMSINNGLYKYLINLQNGAQRYNEINSSSNNNIHPELI